MREDKDKAELNCEEKEKGRRKMRSTQGETNSGKHENGEEKRTRE